MDNTIPFYVSGLGQAETFIVPHERTPVAGHE
jgi:hypothetical protein